MLFTQNGSESVFGNTTIRQTLQVSLGAEKIRIRLSNAFGTNELAITKVTVSLPATPEVGTSVSQKGSMKTVSFDGRKDVVIPNGALAVSDPIDISIKTGSPLMISIYLEGGQSGFSVTGHPGSRTTSYLAFGDWADAQNITDPSVQSTDHWFVHSPNTTSVTDSFRYLISGVEALMPAQYKSFAIVGDSITDGRGSTTNANNR